MTDRPWFDRLNRFRIAAGFLYVPFLITMLGQITGFNLRDLIGLWGVRAVYYVGLALLTVALASDQWEVYAGKRRVKQMLDKQRAD